MQPTEDWHMRRVGIQWVDSKVAGATSDLHEVASCDSLPDVGIVVLVPEVCALHFHPHARTDTHLQAHVTSIQAHMSRQRMHCE